MDIRMEIDDQAANALFSKNVFDKQSVLSAVYWLTGKYRLEVQDTESDYRVVMTQPEGFHFDKLDVQHDIESLYTNVLDEQLRLILEAKAGNIRELIVRHAFSPIDLKNEVSL